MTREGLLIYLSFIMCILVMMLGVKWIGERLLTEVSEFAYIFFTLMMYLVFLVPLLYMVRKAARYETIRKEQQEREKNSDTDR